MSKVRLWIYVGVISFSVSVYSQINSDDLNSGLRLNHEKKYNEAILALSQNPRPHGCKKLTDKGGYRIRVGNYRILYTVDDKAKAVVVYRIKIRGEATYK